MKRLKTETFYFHFENLPDPDGWNKTFLCYEVKRRQDQKLLRKGVFQNQVEPYMPLHAELRFLSWFHDTLLCPLGSYQVTLYVSWSPCSECAEELTTFLAGHRNVTMTIYVAQLYYCNWKSPNREGLKILIAEDARLRVMFYDEFLYCWRNFVKNDYNNFDPWSLLDENSRYHNRILQNILKEPMKRLKKETFYFHFENLPYAYGRNKTFLCYEVKRERDNKVLHKGVVQNQVSPCALHAELSFISCFHATELCLDETYKVTWYISWSPCVECAEEIVKFLANHRNVFLTVFIARLYYYWEHTFKEGLQALDKGGVQMHMMCLQDFKDCWSLFVCSETFRPWKRLRKYYLFQNKTLKQILRREMTLKEETFRVQFNNAYKAPKPYRRRVTYLCYQLQEANGDPLTKGCLRTKKGYHAESRFIKRICSMDLGQDQSYQVTCFLTWSPCPHCAQELVSFKRAHPHLRLQIFTARLFFHWKRSYQEGLQRLCRAQVPVAVMGHPEFAYCWDNFVDHQPGPFEPPWAKLEYYSSCLKRRLQQILRSWGVDDLTNDFRNLQLGPTSPPVSSRDPR
ncbi:DNA dC-_dU-editing enzyme APOBEC-3F-like isoform X2 [Heterocephalus glaber]|nr:DNA dC->dU-editing enzyme APOBEC-3F-like isoform X2 [Heterocephalus glaber]XP_021114644.1 DNA dC->dU-editing enzyme APOBEC-3F-like isoform X2 [Heterocephalus glaber]